MKALFLVFAYHLGCAIALPQNSVYDDDDAWYDFSTSAEEAGKSVWFKKFKDVRSAALAGKQLEAVVHVDQCLIQNSTAEAQEKFRLRSSIVQRFKAWQWMVGYKPIYSGEVIVLPTHTVNYQGTFTNEEYALFDNGTLILAVAALGSEEKFTFKCQLGASAFMRSPDQTRKKAKSAADAINRVLVGDYTNIVAVVDYSQCDRIGNGTAGKVNVINGGILNDHLVAETRPSGPLQMISTWFYSTESQPAQIASAGNDFLLTLDGNVTVDSFRTHSGVPKNATEDLRFRCAFNKGVTYYF